MVEAITTQQMSALVLHKALYTDYINTEILKQADAYDGTGAVIVEPDMVDESDEFGNDSEVLVNAWKTVLAKFKEAGWSIGVIGIDDTTKRRMLKLTHTTQ